MSLFAFRYGTRYRDELNGPELEVIIRSPEDATAHELVEAVVDTGSVVTVVPLAVIERIGQRKFVPGRARVTVADGSYVEVPTYEVQVCIGKHTYPISAVGMPKPYLLLGRDILNKYLLHLDAPNKVWGTEPSCFE